MLTGPTHAKNPLPAPVVDTIPAYLVEELDRFVVRDDLLPGGTKRRAVQPLLEPGREYVYPGPVYGYAQLALAYSASLVGAIATLFVAKRAEMYPTTARAMEAGAKVMEVPHGYLNVVQAAARRYCEDTGAVLLPFGLDTYDTMVRIADAAKSTGLLPTQVWCVAGSGTLTRSLQLAWPEAEHFAIAVGKSPNIGTAKLIEAPEKFEQPVNRKLGPVPPFPSTPNYDAKGWRYFVEHSKPGALFWNVGS